MGNHVDCELNYGAVFDVGEVEFPWNKEEFDSEINEWWLYSVLGWEKPSEIFEEYYPLQKKLLKKNPVPVRIVYYGHYEYMESDEIMLSVGEKIYSSDGEPKLITFRSMNEMVSDQQKESLLVFCEKYIGKPKEVGWFITGNYG